MDCITSLIGKPLGPMNGKIEPRACKYCKYYGHTRQWCKKRILDQAVREQREIDAMLNEDNALIAKYIDFEPSYNYDDGQAQTFDDLHMPYTISPYVGPIVGARGAEHHGKWTFDTDGNVIANVVVVV